MSRDLIPPSFRHLAWRLLRIVARDLTAGGAHLLGRRVADLVWWCDARGRRVVADNVAPFVPAPEARLRTVRACYRASADHLAYMLRLDRRRRTASVTMHDPWGVFSGALPCAGPLVLTTVHADWTRLLATVHQLGLFQDLAVIALPAGDAWADALLADLHASCGATVLPWTDAPRAALRHLRAGGVLGVLADRDYAGDGLPMTLAGRAWRVPTGPAKLAQRSGATLVPMAWMRGTLLVGRPLRVGVDGTVIEVTRSLARFHLRTIAANPGRWIAFHQMWDTADVSGTGNPR